MIEILIFVGIIIGFFLVTVLLLEYFLPKNISRFIILVFNTIISYILNATLLGNIWPITEFIFLLFFGICVLLTFSAHKFKRQYIIMLVSITFILLFLLSIIPSQPFEEEYSSWNFSSCNCDCNGLKKTKFFFILPSETYCIGDATCYK